MANNRYTTSVSRFEKTDIEVQTVNPVIDVDESKETTQKVEQLKEIVQKRNQKGMQGSENRNARNKIMESDNQLSGS